MTLKELTETLEVRRLYVYTVENDQYVTIAKPNVRGDAAEYYAEHKKLHTAAESGEYIVKKIDILELASDAPYIAIECERR